MEINIDKSQVMRVSRSNQTLQIKVNNREQKVVDHFKYFGTVLRDGYCTREIRMRIAIAKEAFNRKVSPLTCKRLNSKRNWLDVMFGALLYMAQRPEHKENWSRSIWRALKCGAGGEWRR